MVFIWTGILRLGPWQWTTLGANSLVNLNPWLREVLVLHFGWMRQSSPRGCACIQTQDPTSCSSRPQRVTGESWTTQTEAGHLKHRFSTCGLWPLRGWPTLSRGVLGQIFTLWVIILANSQLWKSNGHNCVAESHHQMRNCTKGSQYSEG